MQVKHLDDFRDEDGVYDVIGYVRQGCAYTREHIDEHPLAQLMESLIGCKMYGPSAVAESIVVGLLDQILSHTGPITDIRRASLLVQVAAELTGLIDALLDYSSSAQAARVVSREVGHA